MASFVLELDKKAKAPTLLSLAEELSLNYSAGATAMISKPSPQPQAEPKLVPGGERILLVEDEQLLARMWEGILGYLGYEVSIRSCGQDALDTFRKSPEAFDLVITDQVMPGLSGTELVGNLRNVRPDIPVILMTGYSETVTPEVIEQLGIQAFIMKPTSTNDLAETIRGALQA